MNVLSKWSKEAFTCEVNKTKSITFFFHGWESADQKEYWEDNIEDQGYHNMERFFLEEVFDFRIVDPEENGDMTSGWIFSDDIHDWWDDAYAIRFFLEELILFGKITFDFARYHRRHFDNSYDAADYLEFHDEWDGLWAITVGNPPSRALEEHIIREEENILGVIQTSFNPFTWAFLTNLRIDDLTLSDVDLANLLSALETNIKNHYEAFDESFHRAPQE